MSDKLFSIYRSSAGSGKTRTLAKEYLKLALRFRADYYKHILAVTFTNKATQEMKTRILNYLNAFSKGQVDSLARELMQELKIDAPTFQERANDLRSDILHNYSQFSISTIDAFFQKVIRSFTREAGLSGDYRLEIDQEAVVEEVVDKLVDELGANEQLTRWLIDFAKENLENDKPWDVRSSLHDFAQEIFREEFRAIEDELIRATATPDYFKNLQAELKKKSFGFVQTIRKYAQDSLDIIHTNGWSRDDFKYQYGGVYAFLWKFSKITSVKEANEAAIGAMPRKQYQETKNWPNDKSPFKTAIEATAENELLPQLLSLLEYRDKYYTEALSAEVVLTNFYAFGLVADLSRKLREHKEENNMMLLADAPKFLNGIIQDSDTPFIYEKVGSFYRNYLIDEFQDTSVMQWNNFKPLLINSLDQGYPGLVVGDVKQSIYRWRGGDLQLLQQNVEHHIGAERVNVKELSSNFRSATHVVNFNNAFFEAASQLAEKETGVSLLGESYRDVKQHVSKDEVGFVKVQFIRQEDRETSWKEEALALIPTQLERLQDQGVRLSDIAILVRNNREGVTVAEHLLLHKSQQKETQYRYDVISNESLRLDGAITINILVSALQYLVNPENLVARAQLSYDLARLSHAAPDLHAAFSISDKESFKKKLPTAFVKEMVALKKLPLYELTETLIEIFSLSKATGELAYLQTFQGLVLDFYTRERNDIRAFLEWWEINKSKKSVQVSGNVDAVQIFSIHKSKGLQFNYVIIPFCSWEIDHSSQKAPTLWVKTREKPFTEEAIVPVKYGSVLEDTIFSNAYKQEKMRTYLDNLNLLYVAFTRAESGLIIYAPHPDLPKAKNTVARLLHSSIMNSPSLTENWKEGEGLWQVGVPGVAVHKQIETENTSIALHRYEVNRWRNRMLLRKKSDNIFREQGWEDNENRKYGLLLHAVFSRIRYGTEVEEVLNQAREEGLINSSEHAAMKQQFERLLQQEQVASWFDSSWEVRTEAPILSPDKADVRVDRIMFKEDRVVVIDYKSGEPRKKDEEQVLSYMSILAEMEYVNIEGYLLYLASGSVVPIKSAVVKKKENNQLGLGL